MKEIMKSYKDMTQDEFLAVIKDENEFCKKISEKLEKCPFCGGTDFDITSKRTFDYLKQKNGGAMIRISCKNCDCEKGNYDDKNSFEECLQTSINEWNERV